MVELTVGFDFEQTSVVTAETQAVRLFVTTNLKQGQQQNTCLCSRSAVGPRGAVSARMHTPAEICIAVPPSEALKHNRVRASASFIARSLDPRRLVARAVNLWIPSEPVEDVYQFVWHDPRLATENPNGMPFADGEVAENLVRLHILRSYGYHVEAVTKPRNASKALGLSEDGSRIIPRPEHVGGYPKLLVTSGKNAKELFELVHDKCTTLESVMVFCYDKKDYEDLKEWPKVIGV